jgi:hypothetical protein
MMKGVDCVALRVWIASPLKRLAMTEEERHFVFFYHSHASAMTKNMCLYENFTM